MVETIYERSADYVSALDDLLVLIHNVALYQHNPKAVSAKGMDGETTVELAAVAGCVIVCLFAGFWLGQLQLLSRDLRGSELGSAVWGSYRALNLKRRLIAEAVTRQHEGHG